MLTRHAIFQGRHRGIEAQRWELIPANVRALVYKLMSVDARKRPTASAALAELLAAKQAMETGLGGADSSRRYFSN